MSAAKRRSFAICLGLALFALVSGVQAADSASRPACLVSNERTGSGSRSLQEGIDAAAAGDTLVVHGTCVGNSTIDKNLALKGVSNKPFGVATLDGGSGGSVLTIVSAGCCERVTVAIRGLTIANGSSSFGAGIVNFGSDVTLTNSIVSGNTASLSGGGIANFGDGANFGGNPIFDGDLTLIDSSVTGNHALNGGGGIYNAAGDVTLIRSEVSDNEAAVGGGGVLGGGFGRFSNFSFTQSTVDGNTAGGPGGGVALFGRAGITMTSSSVSGNTSGGDGGGVYGEFNTGGSFFASTITGNTAGGSGGGVFSNFSSFFLSDSTVSGNTAVDGGGIYNSGAINEPGFVRFGSVTLVNSAVTGNTATDSGGGIANFDGQLTVTDSTVSGNDAGVGGGIFNSGGTVTLTGNNVFSDNDPNDCTGVFGC